MEERGACHAISSPPAPSRAGSCLQIAPASLGAIGTSGCQKPVSPDECQADHGTPQRGHRVQQGQNLKRLLCEICPLTLTGGETSVRQGRERGGRPSQIPLSTHPGRYLHRKRDCIPHGLGE